MYVAIDPSFSQTGVTLLSWSNRLLLFERITKDTTLGDRTFSSIVHHALIIEDKLENTIRAGQATFNSYVGQSHSSISEPSRSLNNDTSTIWVENNDVVTHVIMEIPPHASFFSAGLFALDAIISTSCLREQGHLEQLWMINPNFIPYLHEKRSYKKKQSSDLAKTMVDVMVQKLGFTLLGDRKTFNNDEAESFLLMCLLLSKLHPEEVCEHLIPFCARLGGPGNDMWFERGESGEWLGRKTAKVVLPKPPKLPRKKAVKP